MTSEYFFILGQIILQHILDNLATRYEEEGGEGKEDELERQILSEPPKSFNKAMSKLIWQPKAVTDINLSNVKSNGRNNLESLRQPIDGDLTKTEKTTPFDTSNNIRDLSELRTSVLRNFERVNKHLNSKHSERVKNIAKKKKRDNNLNQKGK